MGGGQGIFSPSLRVWCFGLPVRPCLGRRPGCGLWGRLLLLRRTPRRGYYFQQGQRVRLLPRTEVWDPVFPPRDSAGVRPCGDRYSRSARTRAGPPKSQSWPTLGLPDGQRAFSVAPAAGGAGPRPARALPSPSGSHYGSRRDTAGTLHSLPVYLSSTT